MTLQDILRRHPLCYKLTPEIIQTQIDLFKSIIGLSQEQSLQIFYDFTNAFLCLESQLINFKTFSENHFAFKNEDELKEFIIEYSFLIIEPLNRIEDHYYQLRKFGVYCNSISNSIKKYPFFLYGETGY